MKSYNHNRHELKDAVHESRLFFNRALIAFLLVFLIFSGLIYRAYFLQVTKHQDFITKSDRNRITLVAEAPVRGIIFDRNGVILADNRSVFSLELIPEKVPKMQHTLNALQKLFDIPEEQIDDFKGRVKLARKRGFKNLVLLSKVDEQQRAVFEVNRHLFPGVIIEARLVRYYPFAKDMVHLLGYVGRINNRELATLDLNNYKVTRHIGKVGLEKHYESLLHGKVGFREVEMDVHGRVIRVLKRTPPVPGVSLTLSIDSQLQLLTAKHLGEKRGAAVAVDPQNGEVLALVSTPGYDPNAFVTGIAVVDYKKLLDSPDRPLFNRALRGQYPPGSTIKPMLGLAALEYGIINAKDKIKDPGWYQLENEERFYRDHNWRKGGGGGHGMVDIRKALELSCDTYYYQLAFNMGINKIHESMSRFGFGELTGIDMGEEKSGLLPSRQWKKDRLRERWYPGETVIVGIGQGFWTATPLQLANATAILANRGTRFDLHLVTETISGEIKQQITPQLAKKQIIASSKNLEIVLDGMRRASKTGTARKSFSDAKYTSGSKTGTAQLKSFSQGEEYDESKVSLRHRDNAMFVVFAPFEEPKIALSVVLENQGHGGETAAPVARKIVDGWLLRESNDG